MESLFLHSGIAIIICISFLQLFLLIKVTRLLKFYKKTSEGEQQQVDLPFLKDKHDVNELTADFNAEIKMTVLLKMFSIRNAVNKQVANIHAKAIENTPKTVGISTKMLAAVFSNNELKLITYYWELFNDYINDYWITKNNNIKTVFVGDFANKTGDVGKMIIASEQLLIQLDKIIADLQSGL